MTTGFAISSAVEIHTLPVCMYSGDRPLPELAAEAAAFVAAERHRMEFYTGAGELTKPWAPLDRALQKS